MDQLTLRSHDWIVRVGRRAVQRLKTTTQSVAELRSRDFFYLGQNNPLSGTKTQTGHCNARCPLLGGKADNIPRRELFRLVTNSDIDLIASVADTVVIPRPSPEPGATDTTGNH